MKRKFRWIDLALLPFGMCVLFLLLLGKLFGLTYKQISVVFNLWVQGAVLALSGLALWNRSLQDDGVIFDVVAGTICSLTDLWYRICVCFLQNAAALSSAIRFSV